MGKINEINKTNEISKVDKISNINKIDIIKSNQVSKATFEALFLFSSIYINGTEKNVSIFFNCAPKRIRRKKKESKGIKKKQRKNLCAKA